MNSNPGLASAWMALTVLCLAFVFAGLNGAIKKSGIPSRRRQRILLVSVLVVLGWTGAILTLASRGFFNDFTAMPPRPVIALFLPLPFILVFTFSKQGTALLRKIPPALPVMMQSFRIGVELLLLAAFLSGGLPVQMTFEGLNFDVVTGLLALPAGFLLLRKSRYAKQIAIAFNVVGLLLLLNILVIALLSMPTPFRYFMNEPANTLVARFPYILLPGVLVPIAYGLHIVSLRQLFVAGKGQRDSAN